MRQALAIGARVGANAALRNAIAEPIHARVLATTPTTDLLRSVFVLGVCQIPGIVQHSERLLAGFNSTSVGRAFAHATLRPTFFKQFCAGETIEESLPILSQLKLRGLGGILDCAVEADVPSADAPMCAVEAGADANTRRLLECIRSSAPSPPLPDTTAEGPKAPPSYAAVKLTALANTHHLREASSLILDAAGSEHGGGALPPAHVSAAAASARVLELLGPVEARLETLAAEAARVGVHILVDAEQTYFQPAIDAVTYRLMTKHNREGRRTLYATYQAYLRGTEARLAADLQRSQEEGVHFGVKLVRGAYMVSERALAASQGLPSPIHESAADTHACYDASLAITLNNLAANKGTGLLVATHNKESLETAASTMEQLGITAEEGNVQFAQLYGMADHLSGALAANKYQVCVITCAY
mmetsp:Transcript_31048/g.59942  ORF Transcript_31048/g.59942 Transcript_31048/m.59942 type:complete len:417 (+) Transcript_31048:188-1438(+)